MKGETQDKILQTAIRLIRTKSYNSFSYKDIADEVNIKKASVHYHFDAKSTLGIAAVQEYQSKVSYLMDKLKAEEKDPLKRFDQYIGFFRHGLSNGEICLVGVMSMEINTLTKEIQDELKNFFENYTKWLVDILEDGRDKGMFQYNGSSADKALYITSAIEGALILSRAYNKNNGPSNNNTYNMEYFERVADQIKNDLLNNPC